MTDEPLEKLSKEDVKYKESTLLPIYICSRCGQFEPADADDDLARCKKVEGEILPGATCLIRTVTGRDSIREQIIRNRKTTPNVLG